MRVVTVACAASARTLMSRAAKSDTGGTGAAEATEAMKLTQVQIHRAPLLQVDRRKRGAHALLPFRSGSDADGFFRKAARTVTDTETQT